MLNDLPTYQCHKTVKAGKITNIIKEGDQTYVICKADNAKRAIAVSDGWLNRHNPEPGGYLVDYDDGYTAYSPEMVFETGYRLITTGLDFSRAIRALRAGVKLTREGWNGKGQYVAMQLPDCNSANTLPYIYIITVDGNRVPWLASQTDLLADDWMLVE